MRKAIASLLVGLIAGAAQLASAESIRPYFTNWKALASMNDGMRLYRLQAQEQVDQTMPGKNGVITITKRESLGKKDYSDTWSVYAAPDQTPSSSIIGGRYEDRE